MSKLHRTNLIEIAMPLEAINRESARKKSIRRGHPSTLHLGWTQGAFAAQAAPPAETGDAGPSTC